MPTIKVRNQVRSIPFAPPASFNGETRTFDAVIATETPVLIPHYSEPYYEILSCQPGHVRLERAMLGLPILNDHSKWGINSTIGIAEQPVLSNRQLSVSVMLSEREELNDLVKDIGKGIVRNMSSGYRVFKYMDMSAEGDKIRTLMAIDWEPHEASFTPVNFDHNSQVRSLANEEFEIEIQSNMPDPTIAVPQAPAEGTPAPAAAPAAEGNRALPAPAPAPQAPAPVTTVVVAGSEERTRAIVDACVTARLPIDFAQQQIASGQTIDQVRTLIIQTLAGGSAVGNQNGVRTPQVGNITTDQLDKTRDLMSIGMCRRFGIKPETPYTREQIVASEQYRNMRTMELAREYMFEAGHTDVLRSTENDLSKRALISSNSGDFPIILEGAARTAMQTQYALAAYNWRQIAGTGSVSDFRDWKRMRTGLLGRLDKVNENGEFKNKAIPDGATEAVRIGTFGNTINVTRQMLINDDLGYFFQVAGSLSQSAALSIELDVWDMIQLNGGLGPVMSDGNTLIHASHGNLGTAAAYGTATIKDARTKMRLQKDLNNQVYLNINPAKVIVPFALEETAIDLNTQDYKVGTGNQTQRNTYKGLFSDIVTNPNLTSATRFWIMADPAQLKTFEVNFLNGNETPFLDERTEFYVDGMAWKVRHDYGVAAVEWKSIYGNAGA